jgi:hypothetical protein
MSGYAAVFLRRPHFSFSEMNRLSFRAGERIIVNGSSPLSGFLIQ